MMRITFLGTGTSQGVPVIGCRCPACTSTDSRDKRLRSSVLIQTERTNLLIDAGPDFRQQMLCAGIDRLDGILLTHEHRDHISGLDDVRAFNYLSGKSMPVYAESRVLKVIQREFSYVFDPSPYKGSPQFSLLSMDDSPFIVGDLQVQPIRLFHHRLPIFGFRLNEFAYITDGSYLPPASLAMVSNCNLLAISAIRKEEHYSHFSLSQALDIVALAKPVRACLTHVSHAMGPVITVESELPPGVEFAFDGLVIDI